MTHETIMLKFMHGEDYIEYPVYHEFGKNLEYYLQMEENGPIVMAWIYKCVGTENISFYMGDWQIYLRSSIGDIKRKAQSLNKAPVGSPILAFIDVYGDSPYNVGFCPDPFEEDEFSNITFDADSYDSSDTSDCSNGIDEYASNTFE
ncbi:hypothetical protein IWW38_002344 [Coemansia aciculifera]|uniref:Uncharacterized protein n=1 Tax=Coemansia aciculifera TaxID=417176 RepID=A0ACC1M3T4_9FUNG|nr:hypothetical protein IWW38_002344 [Coemansia aciculifera]